MKNLSIAVFLISLCSYVSAQTIPAAAITSILLTQDTTLLPLSNFTVTQKDNKALLRWKLDTVPAAESFYVVERSNTGTDFSLVGVIKNTNTGWFDFTDDSPPKGKIFYRIKLSTGQTSLYSAAVQTTAVTDIACKFYPNPVDKVLIIRSELGLELQISDPTGKALITDKFPGGLKVIDVSSLEPGIYVITLFQKETNRLLTEKLVKK